MVANYLIGLREGLETALVVGILVAYLVKTGRRDALAQLWRGVGIAVCVCLALGAALTFGPRGLTLEAQQAIRGVLSIGAVALVTWMIFWMARTVRHLETDLEHRLDDAMAAGRWAVFTMALLTVGREGLETGLFLWAAAASTGSTTHPLLGGALGLATAVALGWAIYLGTVRLNLRVFFAWTGIFLVVVAAGVLSYGVHDLQEAGILPGRAGLAFDVSGTVTPGGGYDTILKGIFNFSPVTTWLALCAWFAYLAPTLALFVRTGWSAASGAPRAAAAPTGSASAGSASAAADAAVLAWRPTTAES